jgi:zinc-ribbon domain
MIVTCPSCATRHDFANALRAPGDVRITCKACGNRWIELEDDDIIDVEPVRRFGRHPRPSRLIEYDDDERHAEPDDGEVRRLVEAAHQAQAGFAERQAARKRTMRQWTIYAFVAMVPFFGFGLFPEKVVSAAPAAVKAYEALGVGINIYGLEIRRVQQQHAMVKGVRVLTIRGDIVNITGQTHKIPWLRFGLRDEKSAEVYNWTLDTASRPLTSFMTRVASPPEKAVDVQIRFAHEDEIGSKG